MSQSHPSTPADPKVIAGRYQVEKRLGAGAMGVVYKAKDLTLRRDVAIKTIRFDSMAASQTASDELRERFKREARTAAQLKHPNIVTIYDIGDAEGLSYIAMEFIDGVGLERILAESGKLSAARAAGLTAQVADALAFAHEHGVIHRDIKPANIMVEAGERVKLTDFGIAKPMDAAEDLTATGSLLGTPSYMSPEQARGQKVDGRSDLFSVGCVLYELLAGRKAFTGETITGILMKIITEEPPPIREVDPLVPDDAVHVITKILQKAPEKRYQTGRELADDLLSLTRPGHVPTVREADVPTASGGEVAPPTIVTPPTAQGTISSSPTVSQGSSTEKASVPPVPPTERVSPPPPPAQTRPAATSGRTRRPQPLPSRRPPGRGKGPALAIAAGGAVALIILALGTWWALERREPAPPSAAEVGTTAESPVPPPDAAATAGPRAAEATPPAPAAATTPVATPPPPTPSPAQAGAAGRAPSSPPRADTTVRATQPASAPQPAPPVATQAGPPTAPAGEDFLDRLPEESAPDGRAAGEALAQQFRSGSDSGSFGATGTYRRRPRIPRHAPAEKPAVYGLAWILSAQKAHLERTGRYGSLSELVQAGDLPTVEQNASGDGFTRRQYRFTIRASGDRFRADARPLAPRGRAFYVDEAGYVLVDN